MFLTRLDNALFALNQNDLFAFKDISAQIISHVPDSIRLKSNYLSWYTAHTLAWEDRFEPALIKLKEATEFKASTSLLRHRIKGTIHTKIEISTTARTHATVPRVFPCKSPLSAPTVGFLLMFAEFLTGITLFTGWFFPLGPLLGTLLGASFAYASLKVLMRKGDVPCGCAGTSKSRVNWTTLIRALCIVAFCVFVFLFDQRGGVVFQPAAIFLVILISLLPAGLALLNRMRSIRLYRQRVQRDKEEIARLRQLLATQPIQ